MQVATLFRDNVILSRSESTMNISSESTLTSVEEEEEDTPAISKKKINDSSDSKLPLSVSSLVSLASNALLGNDTSTKHKSVVRTELGIEKIEKESNKDENSLLQSSVVQSGSTPLSDESSKERQEIVNEKTLLSYEINPVTCSPSSLDSKGPQCDILARAPSPPLDSSLITNKTEKKLCKLSYNDCEESNHVPSSQATTLLLTENKNFNKTFFEQEQNYPESNQTQRDITSSPINAVIIRETHGCALKNLSNTDEMEAENLVIRQHNHMTSVPLKSSSNDYNMSHLLEKDERGKPLINTGNSLNPELEYKEQKHLISETQNEIANDCVKQRQYTDPHHYNECLNVEELSQQSQQQMSQTSLDSNMAEYRKTEQLSSTMNMTNHVEPPNQYHINQHQMQQHDNTQQLYLQHQGQQHGMHHHHQHQQHHSELMAYLHHQDQQAMQHPHNIRTYQHYQQQRVHQLPPPQQSSPHHQQKQTPMTCIDDLMIEDFHDDSHNRYKLLSPTVKHESQDDGYETSAGDVLTPNSHSSSHSMTPQHQVHSANLAPPKCEDMSSTHHIDPDPYNFIDDEINSNIRMISPSSNGMSIILRQQGYGSPSESTRLLTEERQMQLRIEGQHMVDTGSALRMQVTKVDDISSPITVPKKRGRKKKSMEELSTRVISGGVLKPILQKERKKHDRFNGMPEEEVSKRTLPDHLAHNLDIIIIGINPGLFAAYKGHHYAGPGNHFWKCLYLSGLTHEQMTAEEDYKLLKIGIGFTNMVERATKGSADLTRKEIKEGSRILLEKLKRFRPKIAVFNGKLIFEVFSGKKDFNFGRQQECVEGTDTYMWVMPSSSARCAQLPRAADKVPFYAALKKFRDYLNGLIPHIDDLECVFSDPKTKHCCDSETKGNLSPVSGQFMAPDPLSSENQSLAYNSNRSTPERNSITDLSTNLNSNNSNGSFIHKSSPMHALASSSDSSGACGAVISRMNRPSPMSICNNTTNMTCSTGVSQPEKKKRGRPKKVRGIDGDECPNPQKVRNTNSLITTNNDILNLTLMGDNGEIPKKKRGRPKKIKIDVSNNLGQNTVASNNCNNSNVASNSLDSLSVLNGAKTDTCHHRNSPNSIGNHQILTMNNCNQFTHQTLSQKQPVQNQRLFTSPMHSPNTVSSYCPVAMNAATTPPTGNTNSNNSNLGNNAGYHQQALGTAHNIHPHQHNHILQRVQHQLHIPPTMYMPSPSHTPLHSSKSPHYGSSHSELSAEISAAISSEHLGENQSDPSPAVAAVEYDGPESIANDEQSNRDLRYPSPQSNSADQQQSGSSAHHQNYHGIYHNSNSNQTYISTSNNAFSANTPTEARGVANSNDDAIRYISNNRTHTSNSNTSTPQPQIPSQQHNMHISDMTSKSLSGLESLVDQIPAISENEASNSLNPTVGSAECRSKPDSNEEFSSANATGNSVSGGIGCIYIPPYANLNSSSSSPALSATSNGSILSPHHYPDSIYSAANSCPSVTNTNNINYNGLTSNFSVSSLTSNTYSANSYHTNLMAAAAASSSHHITATGPGSPMYMDPHMPVAVGSIYPHPYSQHANYSTYGPVPPPPPPPPPPTLHLPSPNYPYAYSNNSGYPNQSSHHPSHTSSNGYPSMFDRIKPDIGYGGY